MTGYAKTPLPVPLSVAATAAVCVISDHVNWGPYGTVSWEEDRSRIAALEAWHNGAKLQPLPATVKCPDGRKRKLHSHNDSLPFSAFWFSDDGKRAAIAGGWNAPGLMSGGGGECYYELRESRWQQAGCVEGWAI